MKILSLKKLSCLLLVIICAITSVNMIGFEASAATIKPAKVVVSSLKRENKNTVKLYWDRVSYAKGYQVYMKTNGGSYKKILTTTKKSLKKSGLKIGSSYYFKVRAYTKYKGKTYYGAFSNVRKIKMTSYVYLVDVMKPYDSFNYEAFSGAGSVTMASQLYYKGFSILNDGNAIFNLQGNYSKISFYLGGQDGYDSDATVLFYNDDELVRNLNIKKNAFPKYYSIDIRNTYKFKLELDSDIIWYDTSYHAFGNVKLYY